jgi:type IV pilus assembly protein PilX
MNRKLEKGSVLVVSLIILLIMTLIGLAGMEVTSLEEKMAGSMRDRNIAFQAGEATLLAGEDYLNTQTLLPAFDGSNGLYALPGNGTKRWETVDWSNATAVNFNSSGFADLASPPAYIIESLEAANSDDSLEVGIPSGVTNYYRVSARAVGKTDTAEVILQTVYKR